MPKNTIYFQIAQNRKIYCTQDLIQSLSAAPGDHLSGVILIIANCFNYTFLPESASV